MSKTGGGKTGKGRKVIAAKDEDNQDMIMDHGKSGLDTSMKINYEELNEQYADVSSGMKYNCFQHSFR